MSTMIIPTVGRKVWYRPSKSDLMDPVPMVVNGSIDAGNCAPLDATILAVWDFRCINVQVLDVTGKAFTKMSIALRQEGDMPPNVDSEGNDLGGYVEWMPYQKGQAAKADAPAAQVVAISSEQRFCLEQQLVYGAADAVAKAPHSAAAIARGIKEFMDTLHPVLVDQPLVLPVVDLKASTDGIKVEETTTIPAELASAA